MLGPESYAQYKVGGYTQANYDTSYKIWPGFDIVARLKTIGLEPESYAQYKVGRYTQATMIRHIRSGQGLIL